MIYGLGRDFALETELVEGGPAFDKLSLRDRIVIQLV
jgi:hypothetical protein